jgi:hypothetical protein
MSQKMSLRMSPNVAERQAEASAIAGAAFAKAASGQTPRNASGRRYNYPGGGSGRRQFRGAETPCFWGLREGRAPRHRGGMNLFLEIPRELAAKITKDKKKSKKLLQGLKNPFKPFPDMANEPAIDKVMFCLQISLSEKRRLTSEAKRRGFETLSAYVLHLIQDALNDVELTAEDYEEIAKQIRKNQQRRDQKRIG